MNKIEEIISDIKDLKIQGATNIAKACLEGMQVFSDMYEGTDSEEFLNELKTVSWKMANARINEPLARNLVRYVLFNLKRDSSLAQIRDYDLGDVIMSAYQLLDDAKNKIVNNGVQLLEGIDGILTHCHSSTAENIIIELDRHSRLKVYSTETRPLFQGRITATHLVEAGVDTTMVVDSASSAFILSKKQPDIDAVIIGCDEIGEDGGIVNKVGTLDIALACQFSGKPLYVATTLLKYDSSGDITSPEIELRDAKEIWEDAPSGLNMINPAFDYVPGQLVTGFITEAGTLLPAEIDNMIREIYSWVQ